MMFIFVVDLTLDYEILLGGFLLFYLFYSIILEILC